MLLIKEFTINTPSMILRYFIRVCIWLGNQVALKQMARLKVHGPDGMQIIGVL